MKEIFPDRYALVDAQRINDMAKEDPARLVRESEENYEVQLQQIAKRVYSDDRLRLVMLSGPSSSGKTTTAFKIKGYLENYGVKAHVISMDDYYSGHYPLLPDGSEDFESIYALDLDLLRQNLDELITKGHAVLPRYDFITRGRIGIDHEITLQKGDVVIMEGIHALNDLTHPQGLEENILKIFISVRSKYTLNGVDLLAPKNLRLIRRIVRDHKFRGYSVQKTLAKWESVCDGERAYLYPYRDVADIKVDSTIDYEPCIFHHYLAPFLCEIPYDFPQIAKVGELSNILDEFYNLDVNLIPKNSVLREFIG